MSERNDFFAEYCECINWENGYCWKYGMLVKEVVDCQKRNENQKGEANETDTKTSKDSR